MIGGNLNELRTLTASIDRLVQRSLHLTGGPELTPEQEREYHLCSPAMGAPGFLRFCANHLKIFNKKTRRDEPFVLFRGQRRMAKELCRGIWILTLKGRQLGITQMMAAYVLWKVTYHRVFTVIVVNQEMPYAVDFIRRVKYLHRNLPEWFRKRITTDNRTQLEFAAGMNQCEIRAVAGKAAAGRSMTGEMVVIDEASRIRELADTLQAVLPVMEVAGGQIVMFSSSAGPQGPFYDSWQETYGEHGELLQPDGVGPSGFKPLFLHYTDRDDRGPDFRTWYAAEKERLDKISPVACKQEHPDNPQEAWEYAAGRIYPLFLRERGCIGSIDIPDTAVRYRGIDWGQTTSAYVCLWAAHISGPPGLLVSPACKETIREMFAYRWDPDRPGEPLDEDDHAPDAIRYLVTTFNLEGLVYIYRELYVADSVTKGWSPIKEIQAVHEMSGWEEAPKHERRRYQPTRDGERIRNTVADRSWSKMILLYRQNGIPCVPHRRLRIKRTTSTAGLTDPPLTEKKEGIRAVSALIEGSLAITKRIEVTPERRVVEEYEQQQRESARIPQWTSKLSQRQRAHLAQRLLDAAKRRS